MKSIMSCLALVVLTGSLFAGSQNRPTTMEEFMQGFSKQDQKEIKKVTTMVTVNTLINEIRTNYLRSNYVKEPKNKKLDYFMLSAKLKWQAMLNNEFSPIFWSDFFTGTTLVNGPFNEKSAIVALYNVWWDAILLFRLDHNAASNGSQWKISSFELKSGEEFRCEKTMDLPSIDSVIARRGQQAVAWMNLVKVTREKFNASFPTGNPVDYKFNNSFSVASKLPVQLRAVARMKLHQVILKNKGVTVEMAAFLQLLRGIEAEKMNDVLKGEDFKTFALFASLPDKFRKTMTYYGYWGTEQQRLYLYISRVNSNIICLLYVNVGKQVNFEMFDLNDSEKYLDAIKDAQTGKTVAK